MAFSSTVLGRIGFVGVVSGSLPRLEGSEVARGKQRLYSKKRFPSVHCTYSLQYRISIAANLGKFLCHYIPLFKEYHIYISF